ncbi:MAG: peptide chain release factor N(5)-glutamine methyltransferase [Clostridia bacterium]|nr:peptide chain release factor N(5)-glutamine methyltransferase [Clostridia bacterium]
MKKDIVLKDAIKYLKDQDIPDAKISAEYLLSFVLGIDKSELVKVQEINEKQQKKYLKLIEKRASRVPLDKLLGFTEFYGLRIPFDKNVLTPRQETELLSEMVIKDLKKLYKANKYETPLSVLDLCSGSGCLGLSIAMNTNAKVSLSDISKKAISISKKNCKLNNELKKNEGIPPVNPTFIVSDLFANIPYSYDIIVCNPPYIQTQELIKLEIEVKDFDPVLALDGGKDGLSFYREIIRSAPKHINSENGVGKIYFEVGYDQAESVVKMLEKDFEDIEVIKDYSGIDRFVVARKRENDVK